MNFAGSVTARKSSGRSFDAELATWLNERSPNFVRSRGSEKSVVEVERSLGRVRPAPTGSAMFDRYAGHVPWKT